MSACVLPSVICARHYINNEKTIVVTARLYLGSTSASQPLPIDIINRSKMTFCYTGNGDVSMVITPCEGDLGTLKKYFGAKGLPIIVDLAEYIGVSKKVLDQYQVDIEYYPPELHGGPSV